jgi:hypothetical protein
MLDRLMQRIGRRGFCASEFRGFRWSIPDLTILGTRVRSVRGKPERIRNIAPLNIVSKVT